MVTGLLLAALVTVVTALLDLLPALELPAYIADGHLAQMVAGVAGSLDGLGGWLPGSHLAAAAGLVAAAFAVSLVVHLTRLVASFLTLGGGAT